MDLKQQLEEKRKALHILTIEIVALEQEILKERWKDKPECPWSIDGISAGVCPYGNTQRGIVYCKNINCHK